MQETFLVWHQKRLSCSLRYR